MTSANRFIAGILVGTAAFCGVAYYFMTADSRAAATREAAAASSCRSAIKAQLLNPETLEIHDFRRDEPYSISYFLRASYNGAAIGAADAGLLDREYGNLIMRKDFLIFEMRIRADGRLGNKITTTASCAYYDGHLSTSPRLVSLINKP